jgi:uncharacterized 2Fe-2S/4Fe-4S cluster protein (DUF4445 family)
MRLSPPPDPLPEDKLVFSPQELAQGWRLGCRHPPESGLCVELPSCIPAEPVAPARRRPCGDDGAFLAVDLGTTSLEWRLEARDRTLLCQGGRLNPQMGAGSEVIARLAAAASEQGRARLQKLIWSALSALVRPDELKAVCLAANPAMTALALGREISGLARAPYSLPLAGGNWEKLPFWPPIWVPPLLSPFVGGDISAGYASLALDPEKPAPDWPFLLADLGTNGEFLLALSPTEGLAASVALGPALEGIGLSCGTEARPDAVTGFSLTPQGPRPIFFQESPGLAPVGITGTGYLSLLHVLRRAGALSEEGRFTLARSPVLRKAGKTPAGFSGLAGQEAAVPAIFLEGGLRLTAGDVEEILKVKAAFSLGLRRLLAAAGLEAADLSCIYLAGALGRFADKEALETLGFFPPGSGNRLQVVGNSSLAGAALLLARPEAREALLAWADGVKTLDLAADSVFLREFVAGMRFAW